MVEKVHISWQDFHNHAKMLAAKIKASGEYDKIIAISRGGLFPAGIISYELDIRNTQAINISSYDGERQRTDDKVMIDAPVEDVDGRTLVIDDLSDTGNTFRLLRKLFPHAKFASVYAKPNGMKDVDIFAAEMPDKWIVFPWDI